VGGGHPRDGARQVPPVVGEAVVGGAQRGVGGPPAVVGRAQRRVRGPPAVVGGAQGKVGDRPAVVVEALPAVGVARPLKQKRQRLPQTSNSLPSRSREEAGGALYPLSLLHGLSAAERRREGPECTTIRIQGLIRFAVAAHTILRAWYGWLLCTGPFEMPILYYKGILLLPGIRLKFG
jgi:hypothetical protein